MKDIERNGMNWLLILFVVAAAGCATMADARNGKGTGRFRVFPVPYDRIWATIPEVIDGTGLEIREQNKDAGLMLADRPSGAWTSGEFVAIFVDKVDENHTRVEVVSRKRLATNVTAMIWEGPILYWLAERLDVKPYEDH